MGVSILYQAIPAESEFYQRLQVERPLALLFATIFPYGSGPFRFFDLEEEERAEVVDHALEQYPDDFGSGAAARLGWMRRLREEIEQTRVTVPGIEARAVWLEKSVREIESRLMSRLESPADRDATGLVLRLLYGGQNLGGPLVRRGEASVGVLSSDALRDAVPYLNTVDPGELFHEETEEEGWHLTQFRAWKSLYLEAARRTEVILIQVS